RSSHNGSQKFEHRALHSFAHWSGIEPWQYLNADGNPDANVLRTAQEDLCCDQPARIEITAYRIEKIVARRRRVRCNRIECRNQHQGDRARGIATAATAQFRMEVRQHLHAANLNS